MKIKALFMLNLFVVATAQAVSPALPDRCEPVVAGFPEYPTCVVRDPKNNEEILLSYQIELQNFSSDPRRCPRSQRRTKRQAVIEVYMPALERDVAKFVIPEGKYKFSYKENEEDGYFHFVSAEFGLDLSECVLPAASGVSVSN